MKTIKWDAISDQDLNLISLIIGRAKAVTAQDSTLDKTEKSALIMDLSAYHLACPLRLDGLLKAPAHDLLHDVMGIHVSLNRTTGEPRACFQPLHTVQRSEEEELGLWLIDLLKLPTAAGDMTPKEIGESILLHIKACSQNNGG